MKNVVWMLINTIFLLIINKPDSIERNVLYHRSQFFECPLKLIRLVRMTAGQQRCENSRRFLKRIWFLYLFYQEIEYQILLFLLLNLLFFYLNLNISSKFDQFCSVGYTIYWQSDEIMQLFEVSKSSHKIFLWRE